MKMLGLFITLPVAVLACLHTAAQTTDDRPSPSLYLTPLVQSDASLTFDVKGEGHRFSPMWGLDQAWISEQNIRKGINHMGKENISVGRSAFRTTKPLENDSVLQADQIQKLRERNNKFNIVSTTLPLILTADQEAGSDAYFVQNESADVNHWAANINSHVHWLQQNSQHPVIAVSPFNEPDYWSVEEGATPAKHAEVAKILKEKYPRFADIDIVGGNTLNDDKAWNWFKEGQQYYQWGNTHQLAGSMDNYASFHQRLSQMGKTGYNDEMHNVAEAMIGLEYGMTVGIWWGFDSRARGEFCDISRNGERLAYTEHRNNWTAASVYRHDDGRVKAFIGSSERQAYTTTFQFLSPDRDVYFDGHGPLRAFNIEMPGGTGYQIGQTNAERVVDITWGEDVQPMPITEGVYKIVNRATGNVVSVNNSNITQQKWTGADRQKWSVKPCQPRIGGDYSFYDVASASDASLRIDVKNFSTSPNADLIAYQDASPKSNQQWYLEYAGEGYYYIRNRESALYMASSGTSTINNVKVVQMGKLSGDLQRRQQWRLLPVDVDHETTPPAQPTGLEAMAQSASVKLTWNENSADTDFDGYMVLRAPSGTDEWNTIARRVHNHWFVDYNVHQGVSYDYRVKAIDRAQNFSEMSDVASVMVPEAPVLLAYWPMQGNLHDQSENLMDGSTNSLEYVEGPTSDLKALRLQATKKQFVQLPYQIADSREFTFCAWVNVRNTASWQRIFDFGRDTDHYLFLTPYNGTTMRFAIKNGGQEQVLDCPERLPVLKWKHVAVTMSEGLTTIYVDGVLAAQTSAITLTAADVAPVVNYLGRSQFAADPYLTGYLSEVRIYNHALMADEVSRVMSDTSSGITPADARATMPHGIYSPDGIRRNRPGRGVQIIEGRKVIK